MKTLLLMRHAKSSWDIAGQADHDRTLNERGLRDAPIMANWIQSNDFVPDTIVCSTAMRTCMTAYIVKETLELNLDIEPRQSLYLASQFEILKAVCTLPIDCDTALIVGHNPGIGELSSTLSGTWNNFPTAAITVVQFFEEDWASVSRNSTREFRHLVTPKFLAE